MEEKELASLEKYIKGYLADGVMVANSGGADSVLLLYITCRLAKEKRAKAVHAVTIKGMLHKERDVEDAKKAAESFGAVYHEIEMNGLREIPIANNPKNRCYLCKRAIFQRITALAKSLGVKSVFDGTNADDLGQYRPGIQALQELGIISPLAECGFTKEMIRRCGRQYDISFALKPSSPCLVTRVPYGETVTYDLLKRIEAGEGYLRASGYRNVRLRAHGNIARIEVDQEDLGNILAQKEEIIRVIKQQGFSYVTIDLEGFRSGSMDLEK